MIAYFDKENLISFFKTSDNDKFGYCLELIKSKLHLHFTFTKEEYDTDEELKTIATLLQDGMDAPAPCWGRSPFCFVKESKYHKIDYPKEELSSLCFTSTCHNDDIIRKNNLISGSRNQIMTLLSSLFYKDKQYCTQILNPKKFESWEIIERYTQPATDIILVDSYISANLNLASSNIIPLLKVLVSKIKDTSINIIIFSEPYFDNKKNAFYLKGSEFNDFCKQVKERLKESKLKINLTYVESSVLKEHDRTIFTNYCYYESGSSFSNFIDSDGKILSKGRYFRVFSHVDDDNMNDSDSLISDLQEVVDSSKAYIKGAEKSYFLDFNK